MTRGYHHNWRKTSGILCDKRIPSQLEEDVGGPMRQGDTITTGGRLRGSYVTRGYHHNWRKTSGSYVTRGYHHNWRKTSGVLCDKRITSQLEEDVGGPK